MQEDSFFQQVYALVRRIPVGTVASYGQIATLLGKRRSARQVGWAMRALPPHSGVPWQRVVNSEGKISLSGCSADLQEALLRSEGIEFDASGKISLERFGWQPELEERRLQEKEEDER